MSLDDIYVYYLGQVNAADMRHILYVPVLLLPLVLIDFFMYRPCFNISNTVDFSADDIGDEINSVSDAATFQTLEALRLSYSANCDSLTSVTASPNPLCPGETAVLTAFGNIPGAMIVWFDAQTAGTEVGNGNPLTSTPLFTTTTFCAEQRYLVPVDTTFEYTGAVQFFTVPADVTMIDIQAQGANGSDQYANIGVGGKGGMATGTLPVLPGQVLQVYVGGNGQIINGGFNGGGNGGTSPGIIDDFQHGGGGGGASDVRIGAGTLSDRVIVAGGGGGFGSKGASNPNFGGSGGGLSGWPGSTDPFSGGFGTGGTQVAGGDPGIGSPGADGYPGQWGIGGNGGTTSFTQPCGGGGGGGYYGGGGGGVYLGTGGGGGGGGSSYIGGVIGGATTSGGINLPVTGGEVIISYMIPCISDRLCVTVMVDDIAPTITCPPDLTVQCASLVPPPDVQLVTGSDNSGSLPILSFVKDSIANQICINQFTIFRIYQATDLCGHSARCTQVISVSDTMVPTITCPQDITVQCASLVPAIDLSAIISSDNCIPTPTITFISDEISNQICANQYILTRTYQAIDACGHSARCQQIITIDDNVPPIISCPPDLTVSCATQVPAVDLASVSSLDNCNTTPTITFVTDSISDQICPNGFILTRIYRATNACGNAATCAQTITVKDIIAPVIVFSDPQIANLPNGGTLQIQCPGSNPGCGISEWNENSVTASDNCDQAVTVDYTYTLIDQGDCLNESYTYKYQLTWVATDACGNSSSAFIVLEVLDKGLSCLKGIYIPNIFSPNDDGINDVFSPLITGLFNSYHLIIFDRWGNFVFDSSTYGENWNGSFKNKPCSPGVYAYALTFILGDGEQKHYAGDVTLIR